jgi:hypothetical protein
MSAVDQYWSFKLLLQDRQEQAWDSDQSAGASTSTPFISAALSAKTSVHASVEDAITAIYSQFETADPDPSPLASPPPPPPKAVAFVEPTAQELAGLTVLELGKLRRQIALQIHPDRLDAGRSGLGDDVMGRCNQMIDAAIKGKLRRRG